MDPITLSALGATALSEGIKFLYAQAGEAIKWWRERRDKDASGDEPLPAPPDAPLEGPLTAATINRAAIERLEGEIRELRNALAPYADTVAPEAVSPDDRELLEVVDGLRQALEAVTGQEITFKGEPRAPATVIEGEADVDRVAGYVAAVRARRVVGGHIRGGARAGTVERGGQVVSVDIDELGKR
jgi:hypothetical protein